MSPTVAVVTGPLRQALLSIIMMLSPALVVVALLLLVGRAPLGKGLYRHVLWPVLYKELLRCAVNLSLERAR